MLEMSYELTGIEDALRELQRVATDAGAATHRAITKIVILAQGEARRFAPRSPSAKIIKSLRKTKRRVTRKARATSRPSPGGLERSIEQVVLYDVANVNGIVYVSANSEAGRYAARIHDERFVSWKDLGPGTIAKKCTAAGEKFIERAVLTNEDAFLAIIRSEMEKAIR